MAFKRVIIRCVGPLFWLLGAMRIIVALLVLLLTSCNGSTLVQDKKIYTPPPGSIVLRVEVLSQEFTDWSPNCIGKENCIPVHFWFKYRARVKEVISGTYADPIVEFTYLQHANYIPEVTNDCYVILKPAEYALSSKLGVPYTATKILSPFWKEQRASIKALRNGI